MSFADELTNSLTLTMPCTLYTAAIDSTILRPFIRIVPGHWIDGILLFTGIDRLSDFSKQICLYQYTRNSDAMSFINQFNLNLEKCIQIIIAC